MAGKGSTPRPVDAARYREGWERTFGNATGKFVAQLERDFGPRTGPLPPGLAARVDSFVSFDYGVPTEEYMEYLRNRDHQPVRLPGGRHG